jgi:hypothetical protein
MRKSRWIVGATFAFAWSLVAAGCSRSENAQPAAAPQPAQPAQPAPVAPPAPPAAAAPPAPVLQPPPGAPPAAVEAAQGAVAGLTQMLQHAANAANNAQGGTPCEQAYNGVVEMARALLANNPRAQSELPPRERFLAGCAELPVEAQQCMVIGYAMQHQQECTALQARVDPAVMARARAAMRGQ